MIWKKTSSEDFLEVVWKTSWKSSGRLPGSRLEDFFEVVWKTSWKSSSALYFRRLPRRLPISLPKSAPDLKNMYIKPKSKRLAYQKMFKWLKNRENEWKIIKIYFYRTHKVYIKVEDENHLVKNLQQKK